MIRLMALLWLARAAWADSGCDLELSLSNLSLTWRPGIETQVIPFTVTKKKNPSCLAVITFSNGGATDYASRRLLHTGGTETLRYQLYKEITLTNVLKEWPQALSPNDVIWDNLPTGKDDTKSFNYYLSLPAPASGTARPGLYIDTFTVKAYGSFILLNPDDTRTVTVQSYVPPTVDISLVSSGAPFNENDTSEYLNFGTLTTGDQRSFDLRVRSNAGYKISFSSQNGGELRHANTGVNTRIAYTLKVNGQSKSLSVNTSTVVATGIGDTGSAGIALPITFTIGDVSDKVAGPYSDNITVTATSNE